MTPDCPATSYAKRAENLAKHGVDFRSVQFVDWAISASMVDARSSCGKTRIVAFAPLDGRLHIRIAEVRRISMRKANRREQAEYAAAVCAGLARG